VPPRQPVPRAGAGDCRRLPRIKEGWHDVRAPPGIALAPRDRADVRERFCPVLLAASRLNDTRQAPMPRLRSPHLEGGRYVVAKAQARDAEVVPCCGAG